MAVKLDQLIDLPLLSRYDSNMKSWVTAMIGKNLNSLEFVEGTLPTTGEKGVLYITDDSAYRWDGSKYVPLIGSSESGSAGNWGMF